MSRIFWGIIAMSMGAVIIMKTEWLLHNIGRLSFFETKLSTAGGSRLGYKLIGLFLIFIGILMVSNLVEGFVDWLAGFFISDNFKY